MIDFGVDKLKVDFGIRFDTWPVAAEKNVLFISRVRF